MLDPVAPPLAAEALAIVPVAAPAVATAPAAAALRPDGMKEPSIFKGCAECDGPLAVATKRAILAYLGKPNAAAWARLSGRTIVGRTTLGQAWGEPVAGRHPDAAELVRAIRRAVARQLTGINGEARRTH